MDVTTIAFLILLGGTPAEHIIAMPTMADCYRAAESVTQFECLTVDEFDRRIREDQNVETDLQTAGEPVTAPTVPPQAENRMEGVPSALKRRAHSVLYPVPDARPAYPTQRAKNG
jgi:hypothetical protein